MDVQEFIDAIDDIDFPQLLGEEKMGEFQEFMAEAISERRPSVLLRFAGEYEEQGDPLPFYTWVVYSLEYLDEGVGFSSVEVFFPEQNKFESYLKAPEHLRRMTYFPAVIGDAEDGPEIGGL